MTLLVVHAHPDDEASKAAGTVAKYAAEGVRTVLVTCTAGERGSILNPALDTDGYRRRWPAQRLEELRASSRILGYHAFRDLGYADSGDAPIDASSRTKLADEHSGRIPFARADVEVAARRLVEILRDENPDVVVCYGENQTRYLHPDHLMVNAVTLRAFDQFGPDRSTPARLFYVAVSRARHRALHAACVRKGVESPFAAGLVVADGFDDEEITTRVDVAAHLGTARRALLAHRSQIPPDSVFTRLTPDEQAAAFPFEEFILARPAGAPADAVRSDLFGGL